MKKATLIISALLMTFSASAQTKDSIDVSKFTVGYYFTTNTTDKDGNAVCDTLHTVLMVGNNLTKSMGYYTHVLEIKQEKRTRHEWDEERREGRAHYPTVFITLDNKKMEVQQDVPVHRYCYSESAKLEWNLLEDTLTISGYLCRKAQTIYGGRTWHAYYTEDIPSSAGPWKLNGLPGLILKAEDGEGIFSFEMFELTQQQCAITKHKGAKDLKTKRDKLIKMRNKLFMDERYIDDPLYYYTRSESDESDNEIFSKDDIHEGAPGYGPWMSASDLRMTINGTMIPQGGKEHKFQPLELK